MSMMDGSEQMLLTVIAQGKKYQIQTIYRPMAVTRRPPVGHRISKDIFINLDVSRREMHVGHTHDGMIF